MLSPERIEMANAPSRRWTWSALLACSALALHHALRINIGNLSPGAIRWLLLAFVALAAGIFGPRIGLIEALRQKGVVIVLAGGILVQFVELFRDSLAPFAGNPAPLIHKFFIVGIAACGVVSLAAAAGFLPAGRAWFAAVVAMHFLLGVAYLHLCGLPKIDVFTFQQDASAALAGGHNPYDLTFPNVYGDNTPYYSSNFIVNGRITVLPYPPLSLFLCLPGYLLAGDVRYSHLLATSLAGLLIGFAGKGLVSKLAAIAYLFSPFVFLVIEQSWTEPFVVLMLGVVLWRRGTRSLYLALGLLAATKQYGALAVVLAAWLLLADRSWRARATLIVRASAVALAVTLPLALLSFGSFFRSVVLMQIFQPFRQEALSIPAWMVSLGLPQPPVWPAFLLVAAAAYAVCARLRPSAAAFAGGLALLFLIFFMFNKQAFLNYYSMVGGCICAAVAAADTKAVPAGREASLREERSPGILH